MGHLNYTLFDSKKKRKKQRRNTFIDAQTAFIAILFKDETTRACFKLIQKQVENTIAIGCRVRNSAFRVNADLRDGKNSNEYRDDEIEKS